MRTPIVVLVLVGCAGGIGNDGSGASGVGGSSDGTDSAVTVASVTPADTSTGSETSAPSTTIDPSMPATSDPSGDTTTATECPATWRVMHDGPVSDVAFDVATGTVYAVGVAADASAAWALAIDACDGAVLVDTELAHMGADTTRADTVVLGDAGVFAVGSTTFADDPREGWFTLLDPTTLQPMWSQSLFGSMASDELLDAALTSTGDLWMSGTAGYDTMATAWVVAGDATGFGCGFPWGGLGSGSARSIAAQGDDMVVAITDADAQLVLARYDSSCTCMCMASASTMPIALGTGTTSIGDIAVIDDQVYVAGWRSAEGTPNVIDAVVAWFSPNGVLVDLYAPGLANAGGFFFVGGDSDRLVLGGVEDYDVGMTGFMEASAVLQVVDLPLAGDATPTWSVRPTEVDSIVGVGLGADGSLYVAGNVDGAGAVLRCDGAGACG